MTISTSASTTSTIQINAGVHADLALDGVTIEGANKPAIDLITNLNDTASGAPATDGTQIRNPTSLYLKLKDGSHNKLTTNAPTNNAGIRCGEGSILTIDDELDNRLLGGGTAPVEGEKVTADVTLVGGKVIPAGSLSTALDSTNPGTLEIIGGGYAPGIGGSPYENGGTMTFNGGNLDVRTYGWNFSGEGGASFSAGIGAAGSADGTATVMTFNGGTIYAHGGLHGAGIGAGHSGHDVGVGTQQPNSIKSRGTTNCNGANPNVAGNIEINGGFLYSHGGWHGGAFGSACWSSNQGKTIKITGGTLIPKEGTGPGQAGGHTGEYGTFPQIGGSKGYVVITGGSVQCDDPTKFQGIGKTAWGNEAYLTPGYNVSNPNDPNKVFMITIDLRSEIKKHQSDGSTTDGNNKIGKWELLVAGEPYAYGAPQQFDEGKLYLWLPKSATQEQVTVNLTYYDDKGEEVAIEPLFRNPGDVDTLKRYVQFDLPPEYTDALHKNYDGLPFTAYDIETKPITTEEKPAKVLNKKEDVTYVYQRYDKKNGTPQGAEIDDDGQLPSDEGVMRFTMTSTQFSEDETDGFKENYWGHRAFGWCEIYAVPSRVSLVEAKWVTDQEPGKNEHDAHQQIEVTAEIMGGYFDNDPTKPVADTCKAPTGKVQIYVDDEPVGAPVPLRFKDETIQTDGSRATVVLPKNATAIDNGKGGSYTRFNYTFTPADEDFHVPNESLDATNSHKITVQYLRGLNYLESANPTEDKDVPSDEVRIKPVDPEGTIEADPTKGPEDIKTNPPVEDPGDPDNPDDPDDPDDPSQPGDKPSNNPGKLITGAMTIRYVAPTAANPMPGQVKLSLKTPSSAAPTITTEDGRIIDAVFATDEAGNPVRGADGNYEILINPQAIGKTKLSVKQPANGAYTSTRWNYDVTVLPDPGIAPDPSATKTATNVTHPDGPNQPGDRIHYEVTATNKALGSIWKHATAQDTLPAGLMLDEASVQLHNKAAGFDGALTKTDSATPGQGQFSLTRTADNRTQIVAGVGDVGGGTSATVSFDCIIQPDAVGGDITNLAEFQGSRLDPNDIPQGDDEQKTIPDANPTPTNPAAPLDDPEVIPADSAKGKFEAAKRVENITNPQSDRTHLGDTLRYTLTFTNTDAAHTATFDALISDPLPLGVDPITSSIRLITPDGVSHSVDGTAWHADTRMLSVYAGDIAGGQNISLVFDVKVTPDALSHSIVNVAQLTGTYPSKSTETSHDPGTPGPSVVEPGVPDNPGDSPTFVVLTPESTPAVVVADDPAKDDITVTKQAANLTRNDDTTHVGDIVRYTITTTNNKEHTALHNTVISDHIPQGLEVLCGSIKLTLPNGELTDVLDSVFDIPTHTLRVVAGPLKGKETITLTFDTLVTKDALNADIGNVAQVYGELPSKIDLSLDPLTPGDKADSIKDDDAAWLSTHLVITSPVSYAPGTDENGGVLEGDVNNDAKTVVKTADQMNLITFGILAGIALICLAVVGYTTRCKRTQKSMLS